MAQTDDQQFCLRWNNFQANITSQFETLRDDEDFTDVTIACEGQRLQAHKVVLSACSPFFKDLFKTNPCSHPIIFMRDVEAQHIIALMEFMYAGEVNIAQAHLSPFLKTAESLQIRGLTDTSSIHDEQDLSKEVENSTNGYLKCGQSKQNHIKEKPHISSTSTVTSSQDVHDSHQLMSTTSPPPKKHCNNKEFAVYAGRSLNLQPKVEMPDYLSDGDDEEREVDGLSEVLGAAEVADAEGNSDFFTQTTRYNRNIKHGQGNNNDIRKLHSLDPRPCDECGKIYSNLSNLRQHMRLIHFPTYVQCSMCQKPFKTDLYLRRHMSSAHGLPNNAFATTTTTKAIIADPKMLTTTTVDGSAGCYTNYLDKMNRMRGRYNNNNNNNNKGLYCNQK